jgi:chaperonin GroES
MAKSSKKSASKGISKGVSKKTTSSKPTNTSGVGVLPLGDRVLVHVPPREEVTVSGIIIPDTVGADNTDSKRGIVVAVGDGKYEDGKLVPVQVKEGDNVVFQWGDKMVIGRKEYTLVSESNILAIVK